MAAGPDRHLPRPTAIEAYGAGGFRFAGLSGLSHRGSILCLTDGVWAVDAATPDALGEEEIALVLASEPPLAHLLIGTGNERWAVPAALSARLHEHGIVVEAMSTGAAVRTYNMLLAEGRRIGALLIAVD